MKKSNVKALLFVAVAAIGVTAVSMYSCEKEVITPNNSEKLKVEDLTVPTPDNYCGKLVEKSMIMDNGKTVGEAIIYNDAKKLHVIVSTIKGYYMQDAYLHIGESIEDFPLDREGNPLISDFAYSIVGKKLSNVREFEVNLSVVPKASMIAVNTQIRRIQFNSAEEEKLVHKYERAWIVGKTFGNTWKGRAFKFGAIDCLLNPTPVEPTTQESVTINE